MGTNSVNESSLKAHRKRPLTSNAPLVGLFYKLAAEYKIIPECPPIRMFNPCRAGMTPHPINPALIKSAANCRVYEQLITLPLILVEPINF